VVLDAGLSRDVEGRPASAGTFARALAEAIESWAPRRRRGCGRW
jgi:hypothetical protein